MGSKSPLIPTKHKGMGKMLGLAEAFKKADNSHKMDEWEAKALGTTIEKFQMWKKGFEDTYAVVTDTFEKDYRLPVRKRSHSFNNVKFY
jgi:hypothetical protein